LQTVAVHTLCRLTADLSQLNVSQFPPYHVSITG
jgi:hypothetical protein